MLRRREGQGERIVEGASAWLAVRAGAGVAGA